MNTPTPAQALGEVMSIYDFALSTERYETYRTFETAAGELLRQHGRHFARLERENAAAIGDVARLLSRTVELQEALDAAEARRASESWHWRENVIAIATAAFLRDGMKIEQARIHATAQADRIAAFLATSGESK